MNREEMLARLSRQQGPWDFVVIGGGATGAGTALDAAARGYSVVLLEQHDFGKGTSSRSTKLVHGGVRYLQQGHLSLVREALRERSILLRNAPHLVHELPLIVPAYRQWERVYYGTGLALYGLLAGRSGFRGSSLLSRDETIRRIPTIDATGLRGGILYHDGQFDDARLLVNLVQTAAEQGAVVLNYARVSAIVTSKGRVAGVVAHDDESGRAHEIPARAVVNATGAFVDGLRRLADAEAQPMVTPSQGTHIVLDRRFLPGDTALMVPRVGDGRVMFAIPWHGHALVGTTDTPLGAPALEPRPLADEVDFLLRTASRYLSVKPTREDVLTVFTGVRPLVKRGDTRVTAGLSRDHTIEINRSGLVTTTGGKWTTYRHMAEQTVDRAAAAAGLPARPCRTASLHIHGYRPLPAADRALAHYGADADAITRLAEDDRSLRDPLDAEVPCTAAAVVWAARHEMARTIEDVLARRCRALFLNAAAARRMAPAVGALLARELGLDDDWLQRQLQSFERLAEGYTASALDRP